MTRNGEMLMDMVKVSENAQKIKHQFMMQSKKYGAEHNSRDNGLLLEYEKKKLKF